MRVDFQAVAPVHCQQLQDILGLKIYIAAAFLGLALCIFTAMSLVSISRKIVAIRLVNPGGFIYT